MEQDRAPHVLTHHAKLAGAPVGEPGPDVGDVVGPAEEFGRILEKNDPADLVRALSINTGRALVPKKYAVSRSSAPSRPAW